MSVILEAKNLTVQYGAQDAVSSVNLSLTDRTVLSLIGPSGCGKSSLLRCFNRMNDYIPSFKMGGSVLYRGVNIYDRDVDAAIVRKKIGMVFQKPNPFPHSIEKNITWGPKLAGFKGKTDELVQTCLEKVALWDEVKDRLSESGLSLSGGQQQRLCIARAIAMDPEVILMDEPCASLDPISTKKIEELIAQLKTQYAIIIVTHSMSQAKRVSDQTGFMYQGELIEMGQTLDIFEKPNQKLTGEYIGGQFG